ncbi:MAG: polysaccharide deacetylase family protein [Candidatus Saganbacteria bacterium]|nr:polysaccharide deacetylase family protein [Candidatus Saganbacteria bacterium]
MSGKIVWHGDKDKKAVALTFDDGPNPTYTPQILDILMKYNIKATFFPFGIHAEKNPDIVERIVKEGHEFGNHTYTHASGYIVDGNKLYREIKKADNAIKKITGTSPIFFRPPFGFFNWRYFRTAEKLGYTIVLWSVDAADWYKTDPSKIKERILSRAENGSIILLHDGGKDREEVIKALPAIIDGLKKKGFEITTLSQLLKINPQQKSSPEAVSRNL